MKFELSPQSNQNLDRFCRVYANNKVCLFTGAGVSFVESERYPSPDWWGLLKDIYKHIQTHVNLSLAGRDFEQIEKKYPRPWDMADFFARKVGDNIELGKIIGKIINEKVTTDLTYKRLPIGYLNQAATLNAIISFCSRIRAIRRHPCLSPNNDRVKSVITLNYDCFLESGATTKYNAAPFKPMTEGSRKPRKSQLPVYHIHGYAPYGSVFKITPQSLCCLGKQNLPNDLLNTLQSLQVSEPINQVKLLKPLRDTLGKEVLQKYKKQVLGCTVTDRHPKHPLVMTSKSYKTAYAKGGYAADILDTFLGRYSTLFIGTSFDDKELIEKLNKLAGKKSPEHFAMIRSKDSEKILGRLAATRVSAIIYQEHGEIPSILSQIYQAAMDPEVLIPKEDKAGKIIDHENFTPHKYWEKLLKNKR